MPQEATLVIIKPDAIKRGLTGMVMSRLDALQLEVIGAKAIRVSQELAEEHYKHLRDKPFYPELLDHIQGKLHGIQSVLAFVFWGDHAVERVRQVAGATDPDQAEPTSIRGAFGRNTRTGLMENVLHASSDPKEAEREIALWFKPEELVSDDFPAWQKAWSQ